MARNKKSDRGSYVGRGAIKLLSALENFPIEVQDKICADTGSSTGGFTEVLLEKGALKVFAIDVGYGELDYKLRKDPRVVVMERTNARYLESLPEKPALITVDVSFISVKQIIPVALKWAQEGADLIVLIKPQFEAAKEDVAAGGVITDANIHKQVLGGIIDWCESQSIKVRGLAESGLEGTKGNKEFFLWISKGGIPGIAAKDLLENIKL